MAARKKAPEGAVPVEKALLPQDQPERFRLGEMGSLGLNVFNGVTQDELKKELNWCQLNQSFLIKFIDTDG